MRIVLQIIGVVLMLAGTVFMISPVPFSLTMIVIGASLVLANNSSVARWFRHLRMRIPMLERLFESIEQKLPMNWRVDGGSVFNDFSSSERPPGEH